MLLYGAILAQTSSKTCLVALYFNFQFVWIFYFFFVVDFLYNGLVVKLQSDFFFCCYFIYKCLDSGWSIRLPLLGCSCCLDCSVMLKRKMVRLVYLAFIGMVVCWCHYACMGYFWDWDSLKFVILWGLWFYEDCDSMRIVILWRLWFYEVCDSMRFVILWSLWLYEDCDSMKIELYEDWDSMKIGIIWGLGFYEDLDFFWSVSFKVEDCNSL